jgi:hypothetical protein
MEIQCRKTIFINFQVLYIHIEKVNSAGERQCLNELDTHLPVPMRSSVAMVLNVSITLLDI